MPQSNTFGKAKDQDHSIAKLQSIFVLLFPTIKVAKQIDSKNLDTPGLKRELKVQNRMLEATLVKSIYDLIVGT